MAMLISKKAFSNGTHCYLGCVDSTTFDGLLLDVQLSLWEAVAVSGTVPGTAYNSGSTATASGDLFEIYWGATVAGILEPNALYIYRNGALLWSDSDIGVAPTASMIPYLGGGAIGSGFSQSTPARMSSFTIFDSNFSVA